MSEPRNPTPGQTPLPVQPVDKPILCNPYQEPTAHWGYLPGGEPTKLPGRRPASYWYRTERVAERQQLGLFAEETREDLALINALRDDVKRWRGSGYENATGVTRQLLQHWWREDRPRRLFFCQLEAVETIIYLAEIRGGGKRTRFTPKSADADLASLVDLPAEAGLLPLTRFGCKMATGSGKTVVMAMLIAWALCNRGKVPSDERFPSGVLACCPNLTVKERLQVLDPSHKDSYYAAFDLVPLSLRPHLQQGEVLITNWHRFAPESEHVEGGRSYAVVNKGAESPEAFARRVLGSLYDRGPLLVLNDEGHHAYRPAPVAEPLQSEAKAEREEATVWVSGLDRINLACGIKLAVDLSATPFYIGGSGHIEGSPFPWLVSDFGLVDAIESGIVKIPRLPVSDTTGRPEPKFFRLWRSILDDLGPGDFLPGKGKRPKPDAVYAHAEPALNTLASQWVERFRQIEAASDTADKTPPVLIVVCDNTDIAEVFYRKISGEEPDQALDVSEDDAEDADDAAPPKPKGKSKPRVSYGHGVIFPQYFGNSPTQRRTLRIDTKLLAQAESETPDATRQQAAEELRRIVATVGRRGEPGEQIRCVVSVGMLTEGWDANNVTHIFGVRAFGSQLLSEQVVGRGLRRMDYVPDPESGLLTEEYVDVYGIPFSVIPFRGRSVKAPPPDDRPHNHVKSLPERDQFELRFPVVEGYVFALRRNLIKADVAAMERLSIEPGREPTAVFVQARVGYQVGSPSGPGGPAPFVEQDREEFYESTHVQAIEFQATSYIVATLLGEPTSLSSNNTPKLALRARHQLFPQVLRLVKQYVQTKVDRQGANLRELGQQIYFRPLVEGLVAAIEPDDAAGEPPLLPILNRYQRTGTTADVDFKTVRPVHATQRSQINVVVGDTASWEQIAAFHLEQSHALVACYARNDGLGFTIPYDYEAVSRHYEPDFLVRLTNGMTVVVEIKGYETNEDRAKHAAAERWVSAVNNWGEMGRWAFHVCRNPQLLIVELRHIAESVQAAAIT